MSQLVGGPHPLHLATLALAPFGIQKTATYEELVTLYTSGRLWTKEQKDAALRLLKHRFSFDVFASQRLLVAPPHKVADADLVSEQIARCEIARREMPDWAPYWAHAKIDKWITGWKHVEER